MIAVPFPSKFFTHLDLKRDDNYIAYLAYQTSFVIGLALAGLHWISYKYGIRFTLGLFSIYVPQAGFIRSFAWSLTVKLWLIQVFVILPLSLALFSRNVRWEHYVAAPLRAEITADKFLKLFNAFRNGTIFLLMVMLCGAPAAIFLADFFRLNGSELYFVLLCPALPFVQSYFGSWEFI